MSTFDQWTIGPVFYSALIVAEALGNSNNSQVLDLQANNGSIYSPAYAVYENGNLARVALFNFITDPSGASAYSVDISIAGGTVPSQVFVKCVRRCLASASPTCDTHGADIPDAVPGTSWPHQ